MIVASVISEPRRRPPRARAVRSRSAAIKLGERQLVGIVDRRRDEAAAAQRDRDAEVHAATGHERVVDPEAVELRDVAAAASATAL